MNINPVSVNRYASLKNNNENTGSVGFKALVTAQNFERKSAEIVRKNPAQNESLKTALNNLKNHFDVLHGELSYEGDTLILRCQNSKDPEVGSVDFINANFSRVLSYPIANWAGSLAAAINTMVKDLTYSEPDFK